MAERGGMMNHVLVGIVDEVVGISNLLQMDLGVLEGQTRGGYFLDSIFDPSVNQCNVHTCWAAF